MSPRDIAERLQVNVAVVYGLLKSGKLKGRRMSGRWRISEPQLAAYLDSQTVKITSGRLNYGVAPDGEILWLEIK
jgi:excisionase family DNA binding protein